MSFLITQHETGSPPEDDNIASMSVSSAFHTNGVVIKIATGHVGLLLPSLLVPKLVSPFDKGFVARKWHVSLTLTDIWNQVEALRLLTFLRGCVR